MGQHCTCTRRIPPVSRPDQDCDLQLEEVDCGEWAGELEGFREVHMENAALRKQFASPSVDSRPKLCAQALCIPGATPSFLTTLLAEYVYCQLCRASCSSSMHA